MNHFKWVTLMNKVEKSFFGIEDNWTKKLKGKYGQDMTNKTFF